ncbi:DUF2142 domain-containing protein [Cryobacterium algoritolerans]|uniref:DUF2142 domain-containing protein n=1 Tax=Cryobacterium algoritolerans TaxID=1259184 RepID=A0A4R8WW46_9MICO|nr:DUF2142 domain-containing protein [Cryobacterium algoritolerans]TFC19206.1 DUF2142 domain-containing protein [Cryobacterium algoritolerans]
MTQTSLPRVRMRLLATILTPVLVLVALLSWSLASPPGASPDDDFHLASIWCGDGIRAGLCESGVNADWRMVPQALRDSYCFAFNGDRSAACQTEAVSSASSVLAASSHGNWTGAYPPVFYSVMGVFASNNVTASIALMRAFNALLFVGLSMTLYLLLPRHRRSALVWGFAVTLVPLGMFLIPSTNPSSWAIISAGTLWIALLGYFESSGLRKLGLGSIAVIATLLGATARADAAIYAIVAIVAVVLIAAKRQKNFLLSMFLPVCLVLVSAFFFFAASQSSFAATGLPSGDKATSHLSWQFLAFTDFMNVPALWAGALGSGPLGWLDTNLPAIVGVIGIAVFCAVTFTGVRTLPVRKALGLAGILGALWLIPTYVLVQSKALVGVQVQPRYILPLMILLAGVALVQSNRGTLELRRGQTITIVGALTVANSVALHFNIRRYVTGTDFASLNLDAGVEWWWAIPLSPMTVWALGTLFFAAALVALSPAIWSARTSPPGLVPQALGDGGTVGLSRTTG